uniref:Helicase n=1 Tax=Kemerovo virus TaxID=40064 RepID=A0A5S9ECL5_9REOV|nr:helicase [Kemerovo virus]
MTSRLILLAPGDVIESVADMLRERDIDIKVLKHADDHASIPPTDPAANNERSKRESGVRPSVGSPGAAVDRRAEGNAECAGKEQTENGTGADVCHKESGSDVAAGDPSNGGGATSAIKDDAQRNSGGNRTSKKQMENSAHGDDMARESEAGGVGRVFVATSRLREALRSRGHADIQVYGSDSFLPDRDRFVSFAAAPLKELGLRADEGAAQKDAESRLRRERVRRPIEIDRIHSVQRLNEEFPVRSTRERRAVPVALATNDAKFVRQAHILFTAPTGDPSWKETARLATQRKEIRAYAHKENETPAGEALITLIDAL